MKLPKQHNSFVAEIRSLVALAQEQIPMKHPTHWDIGSFIKTTYQAELYSWVIKNYPDYLSLCAEEIDFSDVEFHQLLTGMDSYGIGVPAGFNEMGKLQVLQILDANHDLDSEVQYICDEQDAQMEPNALYNLQRARERRGALKLLKTFSLSTRSHCARSDARYSQSA
jgi:hypothetical protein